MCVIMVAGKARPTDDMIKRAWDHNKDGGGAAWREMDSSGKPIVVWKKGIKDLQEMLDLLNSIPQPFVSHFRIATVGGPKPTLTHPFMVDKSASTELEGRTRGAVLFHNGHWSDWNDKTLDAAIASNNKIPVGDWSDTRAMAWMVHIYGHGFMELLTQQKGVLWTPTDMRIFTGRDGWEEINNVWCSNNNFWLGRHRSSSNSYGGGKICLGAGCSIRVFDNSDLCYTCKQKQASAVSVDTDSEEHTSSIDVTGTTPRGDTGSPALTALTGGRTPLVHFLTLQQAEELNARGGMSKSKIKDYRKMYKKLGQGGNPEARAIKKLMHISNEVAKTLLHGTVH